MRKIRAVLCLSLGEGMSRRRIGAAVGLPYTTVAHYLERALQAGLGWPLPDGLDDGDLETRLFCQPAHTPYASQPAESDSASRGFAKSWRTGQVGATQGACRAPL